MKSIIIKIERVKPRFGPMHINKASVQDTKAERDRKRRKRDKLRGYDE